MWAWLPALEETTIRYFTGRVTMAHWRCKIYYVLKFFVTELCQLVQAVQWLLQHGADTSLRSAQGWSPMHVAAIRGQHACIQVCV